MAREGAGGDGSWATRVTPRQPAREPGPPAADGLGARSEAREVLQTRQGDAVGQFALGRFLRYEQIRDDDNQIEHGPLYSSLRPVSDGNRKSCRQDTASSAHRIMKFTLEGSSGVNVVRSYSAEEIRIGEHSIRSSCVVTADTLISNWPPATLDDLRINHLEPIFELRPELVLLGTGARLRFAPADIRAAFGARGIGVESMDLGAACRTFNILVQEERRVAAALFLK
jgi:uncharacterized protein